MSGRAYVRKAAVLGAGVMGAQIAAHLANANVAVMLFELAAPEGNPNASALKAVKGLGQLEPAPLACAERAEFITPANYDQHLEALRSCDLVIEAVAERLDLKQGLYARVAPFLNQQAIFVSNTSGLGIDRLARALPESMRPRFCGMHFFNPPRYMPLVELIPGHATDARVLDYLETFLTTTLGKGVICAKDTPNFIANRIGVLSMMATLHHAERFGLGLDLVDALTGPVIGRPKSASYRTLDLVGLDTFSHVVEGSAKVLKEDPWRLYFALPAWLQGLIGRGALGQKTGAGIYRKQGRELQVLDPATGEYRPAGAQLDKTVAAILTLGNAAEKFAALSASHNPQAQFLWAIMRDVFHYCAVLLGDIADNARDLDLAVRWGFGWSLGPLETWQAAGWRAVANRISEDIAAGKAMARVPLPQWVMDVDGVHIRHGSYSPAEGKYKPRSALPVYRRQLFPETVLGEAHPSAGETIFENAAVRLWHTGDDIAILSFKSKLHVIGDGVLDGVRESLGLAERDYQALVLWHPEPPFSAGADLTQVVSMLQAGDFEGFEKAADTFQHTAMALRDVPIPVVAAVQGLALGGACEFLLHCDRVVAALESYIGLVEVGVGILPAGSGSKEFARRADAESRGGDIFPFIGRYFETIAMAKVAKSAEEARQLGFLTAADNIILNPRELLYVAKAQARALAATGYRPPLPRGIRVVGRTGIATLKMMLVNLQEGGFISGHDFLIGAKVAEVVCGGDVEPNTVVSEEWLLGLERRAFLELIRTEKTQARVEHMLRTGKPLRN